MKRYVSFFTVLLFLLLVVCQFINTRHARSESIPEDALAAELYSITASSKEKEPPARGSRRPFEESQDVCVAGFTLRIARSDVQSLQPNALAKLPNPVYSLNASTQ